MPKPPDTWRARVWKEFHDNNLTRAFRDVMLTLQTYRGAGGAIYPSHATLAARVGCSVRTVQRALAQGAQLGLVRWAERRVRAAWRYLRTSNRYWLLMPDQPVAAGQRVPRRDRRSTGHLARGGEIFSSKKALQDILAVARSLPDLLARRREAVQLALLQKR